MSWKSINQSINQRFFFQGKKERKAVKSQIHWFDTRLTQQAFSKGNTHTYTHILTRKLSLSLTLAHTLSYTHTCKHSVFIYFISVCGQ